MLFTGTYHHTIDPKHRLSIPADIRAELDPASDGTRFYVVPGRPTTTLWLYTERQFEKLAAQLGTELVPDDDVLSFKQRFFPNAPRLDFDPQGRVLLPEFMLRRAGLGREVVLVGVQDHLEIRNRDEWERAQDDDWQSFPATQIKARKALEQQRRQTGWKPEQP